MWTVRAGARPGLDNPAAKELLALVGRTPAPKLGWTDLARFSGLGVPGVNFGPGEPRFAHTREEQVTVEALVRNYETVERFACG